MAGEIESCVEETPCGVSLRQIRDRVRQYIDKVGYINVSFRSLDYVCTILTFYSLHIVSIRLAPSHST